MAPKSKVDQRLVIGAQVHARAASVFSTHKENQRVHGDNAASILLTGIVQEVRKEKSRSGSNLTYIQAIYTYADDALQKEAMLILALVKECPAPIPKGCALPQEGSTTKALIGQQVLKQTILTPAKDVIVNHMRSDQAMLLAGQRVSLAAAKAREKLDRHHPSQLAHVTFADDVSAPLKLPPPLPKNITPLKETKPIVIHNNDGSSSQTSLSCN